MVLACVATCFWQLGLPAWRLRGALLHPAGRAAATRAFDGNVSTLQRHCAFAGRTAQNTALNPHTSCATDPHAGEWCGLTFCSRERAVWRTLTTSCARRACIVLACIHCEVSMPRHAARMSTPTSPLFAVNMPWITENSRRWAFNTQHMTPRPRPEGALYFSHTLHHATEPAPASHSLHLREL